MTMRSTNGGENPGLLLTHVSPPNMMCNFTIMRNGGNGEQRAHVRTLPRFCVPQPRLMSLHGLPTGEGGYDGKYHEVPHTPLLDLDQEVQPRSHRTSERGQPTLNQPWCGRHVCGPPPGKNPKQERTRLAESRVSGPAGTTFFRVGHCQRPRGQGY